MRWRLALFWTAFGVAGAGPFGQGGRVVGVFVAHDRVQLLDDLQALGDGA